MMGQVVAKYRQEAEDTYTSCYNSILPWRGAILEAIFKPQMKVPAGKGPLTHLHPDIKNLHLPENVYIADWRKYRVEDHPALVAFQKRCHAAGLHDPWLRNYAYSFYPNMRQYRSRFAAITNQLTFGLAAASVLWVAKKVYLNYYPIDLIHTEEYKARHSADHEHR